MKDEGSEMSGLQSPGCGGKMGEKRAIDCPLKSAHGLLLRENDVKMEA